MTSRNSYRRRRNQRLRHIELLEKRELMAANVLSLGGLLFISGTDQNDAAEVRVEGDSVQVRVTAPGEGVVTKSYAANQVSRIFFLGSEGNDFFANHTPISSVVLGGNGDDVLFGGVGSDVIDGQAGNDQIDGGLGNDQLKGGDGNDDLSGDGGNDIIYGGQGNDALLGGFGDDKLYGDQGNDRLLGDSGADELQGGAGSDVLHGATGDDSLDAGDGHDLVYGGIGNDLLTGGAGDDVIVAGEGNDVVHGNAGRDLISGGLGDDQLYGDDENDIVVGGAGADRIWGGRGHDIAYGNGDNDWLYGDDGDDQLFGGDGVDVIYGGLGDDRLDGGNGLDILLGESGNNELFDSLALALGGTRRLFSAVPQIDTARFGSESTRNVLAAALVDQALAVREQQFQAVERNNQQLLTSLTNQPRILPLVGNLDQNLTSIANSTAPANLQTTELGAGAAAAAYARNVRAGALQDVLQRFQDGNPLQTVQWNVDAFNQASPYLFFQKNEGLGQYQLNIGMLQNQIGQNIFQFGLGTLMSTGLVDQGLLNSIYSGNGGFDYVPANDPFFSNPAFQSGYVGANGVPSIGNFISNIIGRDLALLS